MYGGDHLGPGVVAAGAVHHEVGDSDGVGRYVLPPELGGHRVLLPEGPVLVLHVHGKHGRMVAHLWVWGEREGGREGGRVISAAFTLKLLKQTQEGADIHVHCTYSTCIKLHCIYT